LIQHKKLTSGDAITEVNKVYSANKFFKDAIA
jgi:hypothetical protein